MKFKPFESAGTVSDVDRDYAGAQRIDRYRIGEKAFYFPTFPSVTYVPFRDMGQVRSRQQGYSARGCCGSGSLKLEIVAMEIGGKVKTFQFGSAEAAEKAVALISERMGRL